MRLTMMIFRIGGQPSRTVFHTVRFLQQLGAPCEQPHRSRSPSCELLRGASSRRVRVKLRRVAGYPQLSALRLYKPGGAPVDLRVRLPLAQPVFGTAEQIGGGICRGRKAVSPTSMRAWGPDKAVKGCTLLATGYRYPLSSFAPLWREGG